MIHGDTIIHSKILAKQIQYAEYKNIGPASLDLRLGNTFLFPAKEQKVKLGEEVKYTKIYAADGQTVWLSPGEFCLATTKERVKLANNEAAYVQGRSSIGRAGLTVENAGFVDPGFEGHITLELKNEANYPIGLIPGFRVVQIVFESATGVSKGYSGKYNGQVDATGSRMHLDAEAME